MRERLSNRRASIRFTVDFDNQRYTATLSRFNDGRIAEIFLDAAKPDSALAVHANDAAVLASILLQYGVSAASIRHSISGPLAKALKIAEGEQ
jgi:ribonucleoside-diphosphate reductase alpha chain